MGFYEGEESVVVTPIIVMLLFVGVLIVFGQSSAVSPFIPFWV